MYLTAGLCNQWENQICSIKIQYFLFFLISKLTLNTFASLPNLSEIQSPKPISSQWTCPSVNWSLLGETRRVCGLCCWGTISLQTEELAQGSWCLFWPSPRRAHVTSGYPEQGLPRSTRLLHPGEDSWLDQSRPLQKSRPWRKAPCAVGSSSWHCLDFVPCKHFTWPLLMTDALAGHG